MKHKLTFLLSWLVLPLFAGNVSASVAIVDQQNASSGFTLLDNSMTPNQGYGQSFIPSEAAISAANFILNSLGLSSTVRLDIYSGAGFSGLLIGSTAPLTFSGSPQTLEFNFATPIALVPGNTYTMRLLLTANSAYGTAYSGDTYVKGTAYNFDGLQTPSIDLAFVEGLAVPEPSTELLFATGLGFGVFRFRRQIAK